MVNDKSPNKILKMLPKKNVSYYFTKADIPRALNEKDLKVRGAKNKLKGKSYSKVFLAIEAAKKSAGKNDLIFIGGSTFVVGEALK